MPTILNIQKDADTDQLWNGSIIAGDGVSISSVGTGTVIANGLVSVTGDNVLMGTDAGNALLTLSVVAGTGAGRYTTSAITQTVIIGYHAMGSGEGSTQSVAIGAFSQEVAGAGCYHNNSVGDRTLSSMTLGNGNNAFGQHNLNSLTLGNSNTAIGDASLELATICNYNTGCGAWTLNQTTTGEKNFAGGGRALFNNLTGNGNTATGQNSAYTQTVASYVSAYGNIAGYSNVGDKNSFFGSNTDCVGNLTNATALGYGTVVKTSDTVAIGNTGVTSVLVAGHQVFTVFGTVASPLIPIYTPANSSETGTIGQITRDASYLYVWTGAATVARAALTSF